MSDRLKGRKVAILVSNGFQQDEMVQPRRALEEASAETVLVSPDDGQVRGWRHGNWADTFPVDLSLDRARVEDFDALVLPGGVMNPDHLRMNERAVDLVRAFFEAGKPVAAICHGPWLLVEAGMVEGRTLTSWPSLRTDIRNAGGNWVDREVVTDRGLVTSRKPADLDAFNRKMVEEIAEGVHEVQHV